MRIVAAVVLVALLTGCGSGDKQRLIVLHTGRMLGNACPTSVKGIAPLQYYPYLSAYLKKVRAEAKQTGSQVFLFDSGDSLQGSFASAVTGSSNMVALFNALGYDAVILGNLDATLNPASITGLKAKLLCPFEDMQGQPAFPDSDFSATFTKGDLSIGLVANFYGDLPQENDPERFPVYFQKNPGFFVRPVREYDEIVKNLKTARPNYLILNWFKFESYDSLPPFVNVVKNLGFDLIAAHRIYSSKLTDVWGAKSYDDWPVAVSENIRGQNLGFTVGRIDLERERNGKVKVTNRQLVEMSRNTTSADTEITQILEPFAEAIRSANTLLANLTRSFDVKEVFALYLQSLSERSPGSVAIYLPRSIRGSWTEGELTRALVHDSLPWQTPTVRVKLSPEQLETLKKQGKYYFLGRFDETNSTAITSAFFAALFQREFDLPPEALEVVSQQGEFDLFCDWIQAHAGELEAIVQRVFTNPDFSAPVTQ